MNKTQPFGGISGSTLKLIAITSMLIDHTGATVLRAVLNLSSVTSDPIWFAFWKTMYTYSRNIGRIAFPIFCFLIVEGFTHTRNVRNYAFRMFLFALISEIPFDLALKGRWFNPDKQNVYFTLLIGLLVLIGLSLTEKLSGNFVAYEACSDQTQTVRPQKRCQKLFISLLQTAVSALIILGGMRLASVIDTDYNFKGVFLIAILYLVQHYVRSQEASRSSLCLAGAMAVSWELPAPIGFLPIYLYNGTRGLHIKYFFYWFYPVHLLILHVIADYLIPLL